MARSTSARKRLQLATRASGLSAVVAAVAVSGVSAAHAAPPATPAASYVITIGTSVPLSSSLKPLADGIDKSVQLAVMQANAEHLLPNVTFQTRLLDDTVGNNYSPDKDAANARTLIADNTVLAEVGPLNSGAAEASMPIYNNAGLVQISPANTLPLLTDPSNLAKFQPATAANPSGSPRTYFRTAATDLFQGAGAARFAAQVAHFKTVYVTDNKDPYGVGLAGQFKLNATKLGMRVLGSGELEPNQPQMGARSLATVIKNVTGGNVDLVYFGGEFGAGGGAEFLAGALHRAGMMHTVFMGGDGIYDPGFIKAATPAVADGDFATSVGYPSIPASNTSISLPMAARDFATGFQKQFPGVDIAGYNFAAYDGANVEIQAIVNAVKNGTLKLSASGSGSKANRMAVATAVIALRGFSGATGNISFDKNGDTTARIISVYKAVGPNFNFVGYAPGFGGR